MPAPTRISARDLADQLEARDAAVIAVREPMKYASGHSNGSLNTPLARIIQAGFHLRKLKGAPLPLMGQVPIAAGGLVLLGSERT
jgi:rhodanese-related sulfurtransferase